MLTVFTDTDSSAAISKGRERQDHDRMRPFRFRCAEWGRPDTFLLISGGRGIRTHGDVAATMVFKTIAIGH